MRNCALLAGKHEVTVRQHGGAAADGGALDGGDQRFVEIDERILQPGLRRFLRPRRILQKVLDIVAGTERIAGAVPEHDTRRRVPGRIVEDIGKVNVHARRHRVLARRPIQFDAQDAVGTLGDDLVHGPPRLQDVTLRAACRWERWRWRAGCRFRRR